MSIFALKKYDVVQGNYPFYRLAEDGKCQYDEYCKEIEEKTSYASELLSIKQTMVRVANNQRVPKEKFRQIDKDLKICEFKSRNLRVYALHEDRKGKIIILGGYKNQQKADIRQVKSLAQQYLAQEPP